MLPRLQSALKHIYVDYILHYYFIVHIWLHIIDIQKLDDVYSSKKFGADIMDAE